MILGQSIEQHQALEAAHRQLQNNESIFAFLDDICMVTTPERVGAVYASVQEELRVHACIRIHTGTTKVWNRAGVRPEACNILERIARQDDPTAVVWKGSDIPTSEQGLKILGTPLGHPDFVERHLEHVARKQQVLLDRIPLVPDVQSAWLWLLYCASTISRGEFCQDPRRWIVAVFVTSVADRPNSVPPHSLRDINIANVSGWVGLAQCTPHKGRGILGQLVRLFANDPSPTLNRGSRVGPSSGRCPSIADVA